MLWKCFLCKLVNFDYFHRKTNVRSCFFILFSTFRYLCQLFRSNETEIQETSGKKENQRLHCCCCCAMNAGENGKKRKACSLKLEMEAKNSENDHKKVICSETQFINANFWPLVKLKIFGRRKSGKTREHILQCWVWLSLEPKKLDGLSPAPCAPRSRTKNFVVLVGINAPLFQVTRYATMHVEAKVLNWS